MSSEEKSFLHNSRRNHEASQPNQDITISRRNFLKFLGAGVSASILSACGIRFDSSSEIPNDNQIEVEKNPNSYDQVHFWFRGKDESGNDCEITGVPSGLTIIEGKLKFIFIDPEQKKQIFVDPLGIASETYGEHPAEKTLRIAREFGILVEPELKQKLCDFNDRDYFFQLQTVDYLAGSVVTGIVTEVGPDGSISLLPDQIPFELQPPNEEYLTPSLLTINPETPGYSLVDIGLYFDSSLLGSSISERVKNLFYFVENLSRSLYSDKWFVQQLKECGLNLEGNDRLFSEFKIVDNDVYFSTHEDYPDSPFGHFYKLTEQGNLIKLFETPGRIFLAAVNPQNKNEIFVSAEGYDRSDPRFQSLFKVDLSKADEYEVVEFPGESREGFGELYASDGYYLPNQDGMYLQRYGFEDEGGGIWLIKFHPTGDHEVEQILAWDHLLQWSEITQDNQELRNTGTLSKDNPIFFVTGKEVDDDFAMTISKVDLSNGAGFKNRIGKVVGWNPKIRRYGGQLLVDVPYDYDCYLEGKPLTTYII